jgi:hypothetical protein
MRNRDQLCQVVKYIIPKMNILRLLLIIALTLIPPPASAAVFSDTFTRADNADLGADWDSGYFGSTGQVVGNRVRATTINATFFETWNGSSANDQYAQVTLASFTGAVEISASLLVRATAPATLTGYVAVAHRNHTFGFTTRLFEYTAGSGAELISEASTTWLAGDVLKMTAVGTLITVYRNGVQLLQTTDASIASGRPGLGGTVATGGSLADMELDNFSGGDNAVAPSSRRAMPPLIFR